MGYIAYKGADIQGCPKKSPTYIKGHMGEKKIPAIQLFYKFACLFQALRIENYQILEAVPPNLAYFSLKLNFREVINAKKRETSSIPTPVRKTTESPL